MEISRRRKAALVVVAAIASSMPQVAQAASGPSTPTPSSGSLSDAQVAALKQQNDQSAWDIGPTQPLTPAQQNARSSKLDSVQAMRTAQANNLSVTAAASAPSSATVAANQNAQTTTYYCGPAAVKEALGQRNIGGIQSNLADTLKTTTDGTAWSGVNANVANTTGYPVPDVLNDRVSSHGQNWYYVPQAVSYSATSQQMSDYQFELVNDISSGWPVIGNAYEVPGGPHLVGHPNITIYHYFDIRGYNSSGVNTLYEDSVHGSSTSWAGGVPAYATLPSDTIARIVGGRGYVW